MADDALLAKVHDLSGLELAVLLCLVSREHGLLSAPAAAVDEIVDELQLVASKKFGLGCVVDCGPDTTLEHFASALLCTPSNSRHSSIPSPSPFTVPRPDSSYFGARPPCHLSWGSSASPLVPPAGIANCVLARHLDRAPRAVQIQALELLRTRRIFTRTAPLSFFPSSLLTAAARPTSPPTSTTSSRLPTGTTRTTDSPTSTKPMAPRRLMTWHRRGMSLGEGSSTPPRQTPP